MGLFGKLFGGGGNPPQGPGEPPRASRESEGWGLEFDEERVQDGPFPKRMRLRAVYSDYTLVGSWQDIVIQGPQDYEAARAQVMGGYYKQFGMYRLPDGSETIRWNEESWRAIREELEILYDPAFQG